MLRSEEEVRDHLLKLVNARKAMGPNATININAPLALEQLAIECRISMLKWVLLEGQNE